jgi:hypothetical protein
MNPEQHPKPTSSLGPIVGPVSCAANPPIPYRALGTATASGLGWLLVAALV